MTASRDPLGLPSSSAARRPAVADAPPALDPAQQSLAEALRVSFAILKLAMLALLVAYA